MKSNKFSLLSWAFLLAAVSAWSADGTLKSTWSASAAQLKLKAWTVKELEALKTAASHEKDFESGKLENWKGILISKFVDKALADIPADQRAQVDLVIFRNAHGVQSVIPRNVIKRYPLLLAFEKNHKALADAEGPFAVVVPWTSNPKIVSEGLPLPAFQLNGVTEIELASYRAQFDSLFLKRRTDPAAIRGEKMYVQNCISCHGAGRAPSINELSSEGSARSLASIGHPVKVLGAPTLNSRDLRALVSYLNAYRAQTAIHQAQK